MSKKHYLREELADLLKSDPLLFDFIENASLDGLWFRDLENIGVEWISDRFWATLGYESADKKSLTSEWQKVIFPEDLDLIEKSFQMHIDNPGSVYHQVARFYHHNKSTVWLRSQGHIVRDKAGKPIRLLVTHLDITSLMSAQILLQQEQAKQLASERAQRLAAEERAGLIAVDYATTFEKAAIGLAHVGMDGRFLKVNDWLCHIVRYNRDALVRKTFQEITHPDDLETDQQNVQDLIDGKSDRYSMEKRYIRKDGTPVWINLNVAIVRQADPQNSYFIAVVEDISLRKQVELALEDSNKELQQFAEVASHDLRAPMRGINQLVSWISEEMNVKGFASTPELNRYLVLLQNRTTRMDNMLEALRNFSRIGKEHAAPLEFSAGRVLNEICQLVSTGDAFKFKLLTEFPRIFTWDVLFRQVFMNVIANAVTHHDQKEGTIEIACQQIAEGYVFSISDDGPGIAPKDHEKIFELFQTLKPRDEVEGSGMGLALVRKNLDYVGGRIEVISNPAKRRGTRFDIYWPNKTPE